MAQLLVRKLEAKLVNRLKRRAKEHGVSMEEETRRLLREALTPTKKTKPSEPPKPVRNFKELLLAVPDFGDDFDRERKKWKFREIDFD